MLRYLPFEEWQQLDSAFGFADRKYEKSRPLFCFGEAELPETAETAQTYVRKLVSQLHRAFLLHPAAPLLPSPFLSVIYLQMELQSLAGAVAWERIIGPCEREWIVFGGGVSYTFDDHSLSAVQWGYQVQEGLLPHRAFEGVEAGLQTLEITTRPEFFSDGPSIKKINQFVHCIAALEHILLPSKTDGGAETKITPTFGAHAAAFTNPVFEQMQEDAQMYAGLYRLRSRILHGDVGVADLKPEEWDSLDIGRRLLVNVLRRAIVLGYSRNREERLPALLAQASTDADAHQALHQRTRQGQRP